MLTACRDCAREVSDKATTCVHCGRPLPVSKKVAFGLIAFFVLLFAAGIFTAIRAPRRDAALRRALPQEVQVEDKTYVIMKDGNRIVAIPVREAPPAEVKAPVPGN